MPLCTELHPFPVATNGLDLLHMVALTSFAWILLQYVYHLNFILHFLTKVSSRHPLLGTSTSSGTNPWGWFWHIFCRLPTGVFPWPLLQTWARMKRSSQGQWPLPSHVIRKCHIPRVRLPCWCHLRTPSMVFMRFGTCSLWYALWPPLTHNPFRQHGGFNHGITCYSLVMLQTQPRSPFRNSDSSTTGIGEEERKSLLSKEQSHPQ